MKILEPIKVGKLEFKNRIMFPPLTTGYEERDGSIGERSFNFYKRLAQGGVGYIVLGDVAPRPTFSPTPKLFSPAQIPAYKKLADACHEYGCKLGIQIFHPEYDVDGLNQLFKEQRMQEARAFLHQSMMHFITDATEEQLMGIMDYMVNCAKLAEQAGVDVIEIHGDRLVGSLCSKILNHRTDKWGGSFENRTRFAVLLVEKLKEAVPNMAIEYKLPVITPLKEGGLRGKGGIELEEALQLAVLLEKAGVDTLHVAQANHTGNMADTIPPMGTQPYGFVVYCAEEVKKIVAIPVSAVGRIVTPQAAEAIVATGKADLVGLGRSLLADPDFVKKCEAGELACVRTCMMCNKGCTDAIQNRKIISCVLNAENGHEAERSITPAEVKKNVAVIGAGIAGLEAARVLATKGHSVTVYEKGLKIGGQINIASVPPRKEEMMRSLNFFEAVLSKLDVTFKFGATLEADEYDLFDEVIVATGAANIMPAIKGADKAHVVSSWDVLDKKAICFGKVAVIGGGLVGAETAEYLAHQGCEVSIIEMLDKVAKEESVTVLPTMMKDFADHKVAQYTYTKLEEIGDKEIIVTTAEPEKEAKTFTIPADFVVMAVGARKVVAELPGFDKPIHYVGDCAGERPSNIENAVKGAYDAANAI